MFGFIAFAFKLIFAAILGGAFSYITKTNSEAEDHSAMVNMAMVSVLATSLVGLTVQLPSDFRGFAVGAAIFTVLHVTNSIIKLEELSHRLQILFASIIGIIVGVGYILQAAVLCFILFMILNNSGSLLSSFTSDSKDDSDSTTPENS
ncbi:MAG: hypothetical protein H8E72_04215 [Candidatus Marinimicrobia bacterium]|nr:hypothetical protein [Candidatus Neomarinimicrobiota bacterium]